MSAASVDRALLATDPLLAEIARRLVEALHPWRLYLFGSRARDEARPESDYDILVVVERAPEPRYRLAQAGVRALRGVPAPVDVVVWERAAFEARAHLPAAFPGTVAREGRLLYAA
jgi:predicted nucleotidyltransferase